jgi:hypothetical protein
VLSEATFADVVPESAGAAKATFAVVEAGFVPRFAATVELVLAGTAAAGALAALDPAEAEAPVDAAATEEADFVPLAGVVAAVVAGASAEATVLTAVAIEASSKPLAWIAFFVSAPLVS